MSGCSIAPYFPWRRMKLAYQSVREEFGSALVRLEPDERYRPRCHACGQAARTVHSNTRKFVRDLPFGGFSMMLQVEHRKVWCDHCHGVRAEQLEFVDAAQRVTHRLGAYAVQLCRRGLSVTAVADHLGLDPKIVKTLDKTALEDEFGKGSRGASTCSSNFGATCDATNELCSRRFWTSGSTSSTDSGTPWLTSGSLTFPVGPKVPWPTGAP